MRVLITGASSGIGAATARHLAAGGHEVFAGVRRQADAEKLRGERIAPVIVDITDPDAVAGLARAIGPLDGLVNNAGISVAGPVELTPLEDWRRQLDVNVLGQVAVTQAFLPALRESRGRVVFIGSIGGRVALPLLGPYAASKFALEGIADSLRREVGRFGVQVAIVRPGSVRTPIWEKGTGEATARRAQLGADDEATYGPLLDAIEAGARDAAARGVDPLEVARAVEHALTAARPRTRYWVGRDARMRGTLARFLPDRLLDRAIARALG